MRSGKRDERGGWLTGAAVVVLQVSGDMRRSKEGGNMVSERVEGGSTEYISVGRDPSGDIAVRGCTCRSGNVPIQPIYWALSCVSCWLTVEEGWYLFWGWWDDMAVHVWPQGS